MSVALMGMVMNNLGVPAISLNAFQVAMHTTSVYGNARIKRIDSERILNELDQRKIVIVTGFQGVNKYDDYTTLGRNIKMISTSEIRVSVLIDEKHTETAMNAIHDKFGLGNR